MFMSRVGEMLNGGPRQQHVRSEKGLQFPCDPHTYRINAT